MSDNSPHAAIIAACREALAERPDDPAAMLELGNALAACGDYAAAAAQYQHTLALRPDVAELHYNLANMQLALGQPGAAEASFRAALARRPDHAGAHNNLGNALLSQGRPEEALACYTRTVALRPNSPGTLNNLGNALLSLRRTEEAIACFHAALAHAPDFADACNHLGGAMLALDRLDEALHWFRRAISLDPRHAQARFGEAMALLSQGDFAAGWPAYEARWEDPRFCADTAPLTSPRWRGDTPVAGRTVLLQAEQGLGDTIQFIRYARPLRRAGARVWLQCPDSLAALLAPLVDGVATPDAPVPQHDLHCPLMSLPLAFGTMLDSIPAEIPYLSADPARLPVWAARLGQRRKFRVGVAWRGSPDHPEDDLRSLPAAPMLASLRRTELSICAINNHNRDMPEAELMRFDDALTNFAETAALLAQLDLVITVDTSLAHLAGAMGLPVWVLLQFSADFRWLRRRSDSPWYPTMRLFRQRRPGDWDGVLAEVASAVSELMSQHHPET